MIRKAIIPVAGRGVRLMPVSSVVPKAMFPLVDKHNKIRPVLHVICEQAASAGVESVGIIVSPWHTKMIQEYFKTVQQGNAGRLPDSIEYIVQPSPKGFGDAVMQAAEFVGAESFMLLLGDHVYIQDPSASPCPVQVAQAFDSTGGVAMIGTQLVSTQELSKVGVASGVEIDKNIYRCSDFIEKPDPARAQERLVTQGLPSGTFLAHCGIYVFTPEIFTCLEQLSRMTEISDKELELAEAQSILLSGYPNDYFLYRIAGRAYDTGTPEGYVASQMAFRNIAMTGQTSLFWT